MTSINDQIRREARGRPLPATAAAEPSVLDFVRGGPEAEAARDAALAAAESEQPPVLDMNARIRRAAGR